MAKVQHFLRIEGIEGESEDALHKGEIEIRAFSWGESASGGGPGGSGGKVSMQDFHFIMRTSKASPKLFLACASGLHIKEAVLSAHREGEAHPSPKDDFLAWTLSDVLVSSYETGAEIEASSEPVDKASLRFGRIGVRYVPVTGSEVRAGWDLRQNKAV